MVSQSTDGGGNGDESNGKAGSFVENIKNNGGLFLAGFIGVANFIGVSSGEIPNILRNDDRAADLTLGLIVLALLVAVVSSLIPKQEPIWIWWLIPPGIAVLALAFLPRLLIRIPTSNIYSFLASVASLVILGILAVVALGIVVATRIYISGTEISGKQPRPAEPRKRPAVATAGPKALRVQADQPGGYCAVARTISRRCW
jgi:hypothetical protein